MPRLPRRPAWLRREPEVAVPPLPAAGREPRILATRGAPMPFSKGRMAQALVLAGADPERAYQIAMRIEREVKATPADEIPIDQLHSMVEDLLAREEGPDLVSRYHGWREVLRLDRPLMLLIGGATGTGKSTLATEIAYRLGVSRITSTDVIRQAMRAFFAEELMPELHYSSFDAAEGLKIPLPDPDDEDRALYGFIQQAGQVAVGANAVVERAVLEGLSTVVEGIHVVPGLVTADHERARDRHGVERLAHRHGCGPVGQLGIAAAEQAAGSKGAALGDRREVGARAARRDSRISSLGLRLGPALRRRHASQGTAVARAVARSRMRSMTAISAWAGSDASMTGHPCFSARATRYSWMRRISPNRFR